MPTHSKSLRQAALNLLARREHSTDELTRKLRIRNYLLPDINNIIKTLQEEGLLSNKRFLENYIYQRQTKGIGPLRIKAELIERGISESLIEQELDMTDNAWFIGARNVWQKRFKNQLPTDFKTRAQQMRFLHYRGFTHEQIESVFENNTL